MVPPMPLQPGLSARLSLKVGPPDLATSLGSGVIEVLGTPRVVALCEQATVAATEGHLGSGQVSVGTRVELDHLRATAEGATVWARAELVAVEGRRLEFEVSATEGSDLIASGRIIRAVVHREKFLDRLAR